MILHIAKKELLTAFRNRQILLFACIITFLLLVAGVAGYQNYKIQKEQIDYAQNEKREQWLNQGEKNPHIASHFGTFVFKPKTGLSFFDFGLDTYTGSSIYLEAHYQHEFMFRPAQDHSGMIRFGELSVALVLQILIPLLIIFLSFAAFTKEKESGTLKLMLSQGVSMLTLAWAKITAFYFIIFILLIPTLALLMVVVFSQPGLELTPAVINRIWLLLFFYAIYFFILTVFSVWVSSLFKVSKNSLLTLLLFWILLTIVVPKATANVADNLYPLPAMNKYKKAIRDEVKDSPIGDEKVEASKNALLAKYNVADVTELPINFEGEYMQVREDFANEVRDKHANGLLSLLQRQNGFSSMASLINPYLAIRNISMALSATDFETNIDFQKKAEDYRRDMVRLMNYNYRDNSRWGEFLEYSTDHQLWSSLPDFKYEVPTVQKALSTAYIEIAALLGWAILASVFVSATISKSSIS